MICLRTTRSRRDTALRSQPMSPDKDNTQGMYGDDASGSIQPARQCCALVHPCTRTTRTVHGSTLDHMPHRPIRYRAQLCQQHTPQVNSVKNIELGADKALINIKRKNGSEELTRQGTKAPVCFPSVQEWASEL